MRIVLAALVLAIATLPAFAHEKPVKGPNGGQMIHLEDAHYELVAKDNFTSKRNKTQHDVCNDR